MHSRPLTGRQWHVTLFLLLAGAPAALAQSIHITLPDATQGTAYYTNVSSGTGRSPYHNSLVAGSTLPQGLELRDDRGGEIVGTPQVPGTFTFSIQWVDSSTPPLSGIRTFSINIWSNIPSPLQFSGAALPDAVRGTPYYVQIPITGGTPPLNYYIPEFLPAGFSLGIRQGVLRADPVLASPGTYSLTIRVTDSSTPAQQIQSGFTITVGAGLTIDTVILFNGTVRQSYWEKIKASGGTAPYTFALKSGTLPPGLQLGTDGTLSGTPSHAGSYSFGITATDSKGLTGSIDYTVNITGLELSITPTGSLPVGRAGEAYVPVTFTVSGGIPPYRLTPSAGGLPPGLSFDTTSNVLSGTPTLGGTTFFEVDATDQAGDFTHFIFPMTVLDIGPGAMPDGLVNVQYTQPISAAGFPNVPTLSVSSGALPPGLWLGGYGSGVVPAIQGTPTTAGTYSFTIRAANGSLSMDRAYSISILKPQTLTVTPASLPAATFGQPYSQTIGAANAVAPLTVSVVSGGLPPGLTLASSGSLSGTPSRAGSFSFTVSVKDSTNKNGTQDYTLAVTGVPLSVQPTSIPDGVVNQDYAVTFSASGGTPPYVFEYVGQSPPGLVLMFQTGAFSGKPTKPGTYTLTVQAFDAVGNSGTRSYTMSVAGTTLDIQPATLPTFHWGEAYSVRLSASGGVAPYRFSANCLPMGVTLSSDGLISGTPTGPNATTCSISLQDSANGFGQRVYNIDYKPAPFSMQPTSLDNGIVGLWYYCSVIVSGAALPVQFTVNGTIPPGLRTETSTPGFLTFTGYPSSPGSYSFQVTATDANSKSVSWTYSIGVSGQPIQVGPASIPSGVAGLAYSADFSASGGTAPYTFAALNTTGLITYPAGLSLSPSGSLRGVPTPSGTYAFTVQATDSKGVRGSRDYLLIVAETSLNVAPAQLPAATIRSSYTATVTASGGVPPYTYAVERGTLPDGLTLASGGALSGTPQKAGLFTFTVGVRDSAGTAGSREYQLVVNGVSITLGPDSLPDASLGQPYSAQLTASGGTAPYTFAVTAGLWNAGLQLKGNGAISGIPDGTQPATLSFTVQATDANGSTGSRQFQINLRAAAVVVITPATLPSATEGDPYSATVTASGGQPPYTFAVAAGSLPVGLTLATTGMLSGTPTRGGAYRFTIRALDSTGATGTQDFTMEVLSPAAPLSINTASLPDARQNMPYSATLQVSGGTAPYTWRVSQGNPPSGLVVSPGGTLDGTPSAPGQFSFTILVTDARGATASQTLQLAVKPRLSVFFDPREVSFKIGPDTSAAATQCVVVFSTEDGATITASIIGAAGWATLNTSTLRIPGSICVTARAAGMQPGSYTGSLQLDPGMAPITSVPLNLTVQADSPATLGVAPHTLAVTVARGSAPVTRSLLLSNLGGGQLSYTVQMPDSGWLTCSAPTGSVGAASPVALPLRIDPSGLAAGIYSADVAVLGAGTTRNVHVQLIAADEPAGILSLSQTALELVGWTGGSPLSATVGTANQGSGTFSPTVSAYTTDGKPWLKAAVASGPLAPSATTPLQVTADPASLAPGRYTGWIEVRADGAGNGPQMLALGLTVLQQGAPMPSDQPISGLLLTPVAARVPIAMAVPPGGTPTYATVVTGADSGWLKIEPAQGTVPATGVLSLTASADVTGRAAGIYPAAVTIGFSDGTARTIPVTLFVPWTAQTNPHVRLSSSVACDSTGPLVANLLSPVPSFEGRVGRAIPVRVQIANCDGSAASGVEVTAQASEQDFSLTPESADVWSGTWIPQQSGNSVELRVAVTAAGKQVSATVLKLEGKVTAGNSGEPTVTSFAPSATSVLNDPVSPGEWISIYGGNLAKAATLADGPSLPASLGEISAYMGDLPLPLYYAGPGQVNAIVPQKLPPNARYQLLIRRDGVPAAPITVPVADVSPGIFTQNQQGTGQAAALMAGTTLLAAPATPALPGSVVELYGSGLGAVRQPPNDGEAASLSHLSPAIESVTATVGGVPAQVLFAGLAPGNFGLYQIDIVIPDDAPSGDAVEVAVTQKNVKSNIVTIAIGKPGR